VSNTHTWLTYQLAWFFKNQTIVTSHHGDWSPFFRVTIRHGLRKLRDFIEIFIEKRVMKNIDCFLVCDYNQIPYIKKATTSGLIHIHSVGLDIENFTPIEKSEAREKIGWDKNKKYILYVGKLYDLKQSKELVDIWLEIKKERPEVELVVIGNNKTDEYYDYAVKSGATVLGRILNKKLSVYYSAADVYVLMSLRKDYFGGPGIAPLESLACNTPVVSYSMRNYIGDNMNELGEVPSTLKEYKKAILKVLDNPHLYTNMRESVDKYYTYELISKKIEAAFKELENNRVNKSDKAKTSPSL
jgi:glycosyltransferase involved in cell wall biosynthesis